MAVRSPLFLGLFILSVAAVSHSLTQAIQQHHEEAFTSIIISQKGLDFLKDLLISQAVSSIVTLKLPNIEKSEAIPFLGKAHMTFSNISIGTINISNSYVKPGDSGVAFIVSETKCNLSMNWFYEYCASLVPWDITDQGTASVQVEGMQVGLTLSFQMQEGVLKLSLMDVGCYVTTIVIKLDGGASWFYQGMINALEDQITSAVENAITKELVEGVLKLDGLLQSLPKEISVDDTASINVTFVSEPSMTNSSIEIQISGLFFPRKNLSGTLLSSKNVQSQVACAESKKMLGISLDEAVFRSASALYYDAKFMHWIVDKVPDQSLLNTAGWRFIIPQLYKKYPNEDMTLNITLSAPPIVNISGDGIAAIVYADLVADVLDSNQSIPVVCISLVIQGSGSVKIWGNNIKGSIKLKDFSMSLKWSKIGNLHMGLIQPVMRTIIQTVFVPYANAHLGQGFPLPIIHGFTLQDAEIVFNYSTISVCGDVSYEEKLHLGSNNQSWSPESTRLL